MTEPLRVQVTGEVPLPLLRRTLQTRAQSRLTAALITAVAVLCLLPVATALFALDTTLYRYGLLFYAVAAVMEAAGVGILVLIFRRRREALQKALARDADDAQRHAEIDAEGITVCGACGPVRFAFADITRAYETREGLLLYCLGLHVWLPSAHMTAAQGKALLAAVYAGLPAAAERYVLSDWQGGRLTAAAVEALPAPEGVVLSAPYADARAASGRDVRVMGDSALGGLFIGCALGTMVFAAEPLLPAAIGAVAGLLALYALFGGIERVNAASLRRKDAKKQVHAVCTAVLCEEGCAVYADGVPLLRREPLSAVTLAREDGHIKLTVGGDELLFPDTEIPQHLLERMNISHG